MVLQFYEKVQKQPLSHSCTELSQPQFVPVSIVKWVKRNEKFRSSRSQMFFKIGVLKIFVIFTGKRLCWSLFKKTTTQVFSSEYCEIFQKGFNFNCKFVPSAIKRQSNIFPLCFIQSFVSKKESCQNLSRRRAM